MHFCLHGMNSIVPQDFNLIYLKKFLHVIILKRTNLFFILQTIIRIKILVDIFELVLKE